MKERIEIRIKELEKVEADQQKAIQDMIMQHNGVIHRIAELKLLLTQSEIKVVPTEIK